MALYDESFSLEDLRSMRRAILEQRAKGVASFSYNGQTHVYSSPDNMLRVAEELTREIGRRMAKDLGMVPASNSRIAVHRPLAVPESN